MTTTKQEKEYLVFKQKTNDDISKLKDDIKRLQNMLPSLQSKILEQEIIITKLRNMVWVMQEGGSL